MSNANFPEDNAKFPEDNLTVTDAPPKDVELTPEPIELTPEAIDATEPVDVPPYRLPKEPAAQKLPKNWPWLLAAMMAMLAVGVLFGKNLANNPETTTETPVKSQPSAVPVSDGAAEDPAATVDEAVLSVEAISPSLDSVGSTLSADGTIEPKEIANVSAKVSGVAIERILVEEGQSVKAGQVLAIFDTDAMKQQVLQAEADVSEAEATLANARTDAARVLPLLEIDAISRQEADRYRTQQVQAEAMLQSARARLNAQRLSVNNAQVVSPVSGVISDKIAEVGMVAGGEPLFTIIKDGKLEWQAEIDPKQVGEVKAGTAVKVSLPNNQSVMGEVRKIAPTADNNRKITIFASLAQNSAARAGMYQKGEFLLGSDNLQTVPNSAIVSNDGYDYVMLITDIKDVDGKKLGKIVQQKVTVGERLGDKVSLTTPIDAKSQLVKQGGSFLNEGDVVRVVESSNTSPPQKAKS